jgi:aspartate/methionine/tyrosine aminotransferase
MSNKPRDLSDLVEKYKNNNVHDLYYRIKSLEASGLNIINFAFAAPGFDAPKVVKEATIETLHSGRNPLVPIEGISELRNEICDYIDRTRGFRPELKQIIIGSSVKIMLFTTLVSILKPNDEVIITDPYMPYYSRLISFMSANVKTLPLSETKDFKIDFSKLENLVGKRTKAIIISTPHNPTGRLLSKSDVEKLYELAEKNKFYLISDETYSQIILRGRHISPAIADFANNHTVILENLSYTFGLAGWGLGFYIIPKELHNPIRKVITDVVSPTPNFIQEAGVTAFRNAKKIIPEILNKYKKSSKTMVNGLNELPGFKCELPYGGVHVFPEVAGTNLSGLKLANYLLEKAGIAVLPGEVFGSQGKNHIRMSYSKSIEYINEGLMRLQESF